MAEFVNQMTVLTENIDSPTTIPLEDNEDKTETTEQSTASAESVNEEDSDDHSSVITKDSLGSDSTSESASIDRYDFGHQGGSSEDEPVLPGIGDSPVVLLTKKSMAEDSFYNSPGGVIATDSGHSDSGLTESQDSGIGRLKINSKRDNMII